MTIYYNSPQGWINNSIVSLYYHKEARKEKNSETNDYHIAKEWEASNKK